ncbi:MAG: flagellar biosynthetic protein FliO [Treponema sp.]|jgi:flagellar protein FliO/FliZ|nr:flagellar biosynthetic protein FliO [Treponema sp.]
MTVLRIFFFITVLATVAPYLFSQESGTENPEQTIILAPESSNPPNDTTSVWVIIRAVIVLLIVAIAIYGVIFILKRSLKPHISNDPYLKVVAGISLGMSRSVHVITLGTRAWLVGSSEGSISLIAEITDKELIDTLILNGSQQHSSTSFSHLLQQLSLSNIRKKREHIRGI